MPTSGVVTFALDQGDLLEEAYERCGLELKTGYDLKTARRSLDILSLEWGNRGLNYWLVDQQTIPLVAGTATYALPADTIDVLDAVIRTGTGASQSDILIERTSFTNYLQIPNKLTGGRPLQYTVSRTEPPSIIAWPVPDSTTPYSLVFYRMRRMQDTGSSMAYSADIASRMYPALVAGLAFYIAEKRSPIDKVMYLKQRYEEEFERSSQNDRDRSTLRIVPGGYC